MPMIEAIIEALSTLSKRMFSVAAWSNEVRNELFVEKLSYIVLRSMKS